MRLLSFLQLVETALRADGADLSPSQVNRYVDYEAGLARMELPDGVGLVVQNFELADGQLCLKAWWQEGVDQQIGLKSFFDANGNDWKSAARQVAALKPGEPLMAAEGGSDTDAETSPLLDPLDPLDTSDIMGGFRSAV